MRADEKTKGNQKMLLYVNSLVRNEEFIQDMKKLENESISSMEENEKNILEFYSIIRAHEELRLRIKNIIENKHYKQLEKIAKKYGLDMYEILYASKKIKNNKERLPMESFHNPDMCMIEEADKEELSIFGEDIITILKNRKIDRTAYPIAVCINRRAAKKDVINFIEKKWSWISWKLGKSGGGNVLKIRTRKHSQELLDFIWEHRKLPRKEIKKLLDEKMPGTGLVYYEITEIIKTEKAKRLGDLS